MWCIPHTGASKNAAVLSVRPLENRMNPADINKLRLIIEAELSSVEKQLLHKDAFAAGCFLHKSGNKAAGRKLCYGVLDSLGFEQRRTYFSQILETLDGNEDSFASEICAHNEINQLFRNQCGSA